MSPAAAAAGSSVKLTVTALFPGPVAAPSAAGSPGRGAGLGGLSEEQVAATGAGLGCSAGEVLGAGRLSAE
jgi:hypothetical protein